MGEGEEIPKAGTETVHLCLESRITPSRLRTTLKVHATMACGMFLHSYRRGTWPTDGLFSALSATNRPLNFLFI